MNISNPDLPPEEVVSYATPFSIGAVIRDVIIIWALTGLGGFVIGFTFGLAGIQNQSLYTAISALTNLILGTIGFTISGYLASNGRWKHLPLVAVVCWLTSLVNLFFGTTLAQWFFASFAIMFMMGLGGGISHLFKPSSR